ncbi:hypothetical protein C8A01DRAFT_34156 [Parachaetomium inaequale]|uniref:Uncharacterized protein n=1 Tax=Parachaetomium inaequale TaxID=2588326 RepID=A0AAN6PIT7_9PEZI|nr:hypothetical protein C8A01DRAFT_34156 [Parachaetomium inaequale]
MHPRFSLIALLAAAASAAVAGPAPVPGPIGSTVAPALDPRQDPPPPPNPSPPNPSQPTPSPPKPSPSTPLPTSCSASLTSLLASLPAPPTTAHPDLPAWASSSAPIQLVLSAVTNPAAAYTTLALAPDTGTGTDMDMDIDALCSAAARAATAPSSLAAAYSQYLDAVQTWRFAVEGDAYQLAKECGWDVGLGVELLMATEAAMCASGLRASVVPWTSPPPSQPPFIHKGTVDELDELEEVEIKIQHVEKDQTGINDQLAELEARLAVLDPSTQYAADMARELQARVAKLKTGPRYYPFDQAREREALFRNQGTGVYCQSGKARVDISAAAKSSGVIAAHYNHHLCHYYQENMASFAPQQGGNPPFMSGRPLDGPFTAPGPASGPSGPPSGLPSEPPSDPSSEFFPPPWASSADSSPAAATTSPFVNGPGTGTGTASSSAAFFAAASPSSQAVVALITVAVIALILGPLVVSLLRRNRGTPPHRARIRASARWNPPPNNPGPGDDSETDGRSSWEDIEANAAVQQYIARYHQRLRAQGLNERGEAPPPYKEPSITSQCPIPYSAPAQPRASPPSYYTSSSDGSDMDAVDEEPSTSPALEEEEEEEEEEEGIQLQTLPPVPAWSQPQTPPNSPVEGPFPTTANHQLPLPPPLSLPPPAHPPQPARSPCRLPTSSPPPPQQQQQQQQQQHQQHQQPTNTTQTTPTTPTTTTATTKETPTAAFDARPARGLQHVPTGSGGSASTAVAITVIVAIVLAAVALAVAVIVIVIVIVIVRRVRALSRGIGIGTGDE